MEHLFYILEWVFGILFMCEAILKMMALRCGYFKERFISLSVKKPLNLKEELWNCFDLSLRLGHSFSILFFPLQSIKVPPMDRRPSLGGPSVRHLHGPALTLGAFAAPGALEHSLNWQDRELFR